MPDLPQLAAALSGRFTIERELGGGGMSRVFVATETALGRAVVIKVVAPSQGGELFADRFAREVKFAARLQQANIVPLLSTGDAGGVPYYTMPFVEGLSLRARISTGEPIPAIEATHILRDVAKALAYAHEQGVVHRDIKPENVLLSSGTAMVTDFGIAKAISASRTMEISTESPVATSTTLTSVGSSIGTPAYMAPEQAVGGVVDSRADLYAWGVMAYELLAGAHPFAGRVTPQAMVAAHIAEAPVPLAARNADVPDELAAIVMECLEKEPERRPASARVVLEAVDGTTPGAAPSTRSSAPSSVSTTPRVRATRSTRSPRSAAPTPRWMQVASIAAAIVLVAAIGGWYALAGRTTGAPRGAGVPADRSVAVLPLANLSGDPNDDFFGIGLAEEMTRALSKAGARVIGRSSAGALQARGLDERAIAKELGVASLLTGSVQRADRQLRISVSLISASDGAVFWSEKYDRSLTNVFALQDEIARAVAATLPGSSGVAGPVAGARRETADPEAYELFLQGQVLFGRRTAQTMRQAIALFEQAVARDSSFARAHAALAIAFAAVPYYEHGTARQTAGRAEAAARKALAIDPDLGEAYAAIGSAQMTLLQPRAADESFRRALVLDSTSAIAWGWHALVLSHLGRFEEAHHAVERARTLEPASLIARTWEAQIFLNEHRPADAESRSRAALAVDSTYPLALHAYAEAQSELGRHDDAIAALERNIAQLPADSLSQREALLAYVYARAGRAVDARRVIERVRARAGGTLPAIGVLASALDALGDRQAALALLERATRLPDSWLLQFNRSARFDALRRDPRGAAILAAIEQPS